MNNALAVAKKELRSLFSSPLALVFLCGFVAISVWDFFPKLWSGQTATCQFLFERVPLFLLVVIPTLTMRLWAEERRSKTLELLVTYPIRPAESVLGKFLASWVLVLIALLLTAGIPISVALLGSLDPGPVIGGYVASALVGAAYLSIGLFVSSLCDSQMLAFLLTAIVCFLFWVVGEDVFLQYAEGYRSVFERVGIGSHFRSVARGVIDLRDMIYYLALVVFFLFLNVRTLFLRKWTG